MDQLVRHVNCCNIFSDAWNLCTYRFWAFGKKTPSLLFMLRKKPPSMANLIRLYFPKFAFVPQHIFIQVIAEDLLRTQSFCCWCDTMYDVMLCGMMRWYDTIWWWCRTYTHTRAHTGTHKTLHPLRDVFGVFKLCIPLGTTLELLQLLFRWYLSSASPWEWLWSFFTLYFGGILALHSIRNDFGASELTLRFLRNDFCGFETYSALP